MKHPIRRAIVGLVAITAGVAGSLVVPTPVSASHQWDRGYWNRAPYVAWDGVAAANIQDGAYFWQDRGFSYGYVPPLPGYNHGGTQCTASWNRYINVCTVSQAVADAYGGGPYTAGVNNNYLNADGSIFSGWILVSDALSAVDRQKTWRHEFGHAIGLAHWNVNGCIMHEGVWGQPLGETCDHDWDAIDEMY